MEQSTKALTGGWQLRLDIQGPDHRNAGGTKRILQNHYQSAAPSAAHLHLSPAFRLVPMGQAKDKSR